MGARRSDTPPGKPRAPDVRQPPRVRAGQIQKLRFRSCKGASTSAEKLGCRDQPPMNASCIQPPPHFGSNPPPMAAKNIWQSR